MINHRNTKLIVFSFLLSLKVGDMLVYPQFSVLQITAAFSVPIELSHDRKFFFDWGFQQNYDLPWNSSNFYNIPIWPGLKDGKVRQSREVIEDALQKYGVRKNGVHPNDFTAGEFYEAIENILVSYGFHETCLLKSVCELAKHPFDDRQSNLLTEVATFILSPSIHEAFTEDEMLYKRIYEKAEALGFEGKDCDSIYNNCEQDLLTVLTNVVFHKF